MTRGGVHHVTSSRAFVEQVDEMWLCDVGFGHLHSPFHLIERHIAEVVM